MQPPFDDLLSAPPPSVFNGTTGNDTLVGGGRFDSFDASQGGDDVVMGMGDGDSIYMGAALTTADRIDGGNGSDSVQLGGDYSHRLVLGPDTLTNVEDLVVFGGFDYNLKLDDGNVAAGGTLALNATFLTASDRLTFDASAETDGDILIYFNAGLSILTGGAGDDIFWAQEAMDSGDRLKGGEGFDVLILDGPSYAFEAHQLSGLEGVQTTSGDFHLVMADGNVAGRNTMSIFASSAQSLFFDGSAESFGSYSVGGSAGADTLIGGAGADTMDGGVGADRFTGGGGADVLRSGPAGDGADTFVYLSPGDSTRKAADLVILTLDDLIDLSAIDARTDKAGDQAFRMVTAFDGHAGELVLMAFDPTHNLTLVAGDVDGDGRADLVIDLAGDMHAFTGLVL